jgi:hypothetical protein
VIYALGKSPSAKLSVRAPVTARRWARARPHRLSFLLGGDDSENRLVEEIPAEGFRGRRHAVNVLCFIVGPRVVVMIWEQGGFQGFRYFPGKWEDFPGFCFPTAKSLLRPSRIQPAGS